MPLYKKALNFNAAQLEEMNLDDCYELLLCFRYLQLRDDHVISKTQIEAHIAAISKRLDFLNDRADNEDL